MIVWSWKLTPLDGGCLAVRAPLESSIWTDSGGLWTKLVPGSMGGPRVTVSAVRTRASLECRSVVVFEAVAELQLLTPRRSAVY